MPLLSTRKNTAAILVMTMIASSAASAAPAPTRTNPFVALSVLSGSTVGAEAAAEANATQDSYDAPRGSMLPLWVALGVVFAGWAWILLDDDNNNDEVSTPISP